MNHIVTYYIENGNIYSHHPLVQHFCKIIGTNGHMKFNTGGSKNPRGWSSYSFFKKGEEPTSERVEFDIQPLDWDLQPIGETIRYEGIVVSRQEEVEGVMVLETKRTNV